MLRDVVRAAAVAACVVGVTSTANAEIIDFEDIQIGESGYVLPIGEYSDLYFANFGAYSTDSFDTGGYGVGTVSGTQAAYQAYAAPASVIGAASAGWSYDFHSAYFTAAWRNDLDLRVRAFSGPANDEIYNEVFQISTDGPSFIEFNIQGATMVTFESSGGTFADVGGDGSNFIMDDMNVTIPAPAGMLLVGIGALTGRSRRRS